MSKKVNCLSLKCSLELEISGAFFIADRCFRQPVVFCTIKFYLKMENTKKERRDRRETLCTQGVYATNFVE